MAQEPWSSVDDVAQHLGIARDTVYRWIDGKGLPAHRIGRLWKFKLSEVDDWCAQVVQRRNLRNSTTVGRTDEPTFFKDIQGG